jgi:uncharacterized protein YeaO (DUF488 family)
LQTSYFAISHNLPNAISIAGKSPDFFTGREYLPLAPSWDIYKQYKETNNSNLYTERYIEEILFPLNPKQVYDDLGHYSILLCWEGSNKFCHRRIVAKWLEESLNITIPEL